MYGRRDRKPAELKWAVVAVDGEQAGACRRAVVAKAAYRMRPRRPWTSAKRKDRIVVK